jgi:hypothetical protein
MDYFRCPAALWKDRILKAKRAGLNTVMTYVAWNQHETREGEFVFEGGSDLRTFLRTCAELEMLAIVRTGPFMCDEFEMGGYPAWLLAKSGIALRTRNAVAEPYIERWFERLCGQIAPLQASHGGPVILVQAENEYYYPDRPGGIEYLQFLYRLLRRSGIEVPITACGNGDELQASEYFETYNGYGPGSLARFRKDHPTWPLLISEHYTDWFDVWTWPQTDFPKRLMLEQESMAALSQAVMLSYFCFHGGTNFGFNGSSSWKSDHSWVTNRYFGQGPIAEGGALNPNYFAAKTASLPIAQFEDFFASAAPVPSPLTAAGPIRTFALKSSRGTMVFVLPSQPISADERTVVDESKPVSLVEDRGTSDVEAAAGIVTLLSGKSMELAAGSVRALMLPYAFHIDRQHIVDYSNATLLGIGGNEDKRVVFFWGEAGRLGLVSIDGTVSEFRFPSQEPLEIKIGSVSIIALSSFMADRTWFADKRVLVGPAYVGESGGVLHDCLIDEQTKSMVVVEQDGTIKRQPVSRNARETVPTMSQTRLVWQRAALYEFISESEGWKQIDGPRSVEELGEYYGYTWYRAHVSSSADRDTGLVFTAAADRAHVWANGKYCGVYGRGASAERDMLPLHLSKGETVITLLVDNMGRSSEGSTQQRKGIFGPVFAGAIHERFEIPSIQPAAIPANPSWQFRKYKVDAIVAARCTSAEWRIPAQRGRGIFLALRELPHFAWILLNGTLLGEHHGDNALVDGFTASEFLLPAKLEENTQLSIVFFGEGNPDLARCVQFYSFPIEDELHTWEFHRWAPPPAAGTEPDQESRAAVTSGEPCWWQAKFARPELEPPVFFGTQGLSKGQVYLNGRPVGRYWELGPHHSVYLPEPFLEEVNTLALLEEGGLSPQGTFLMRDANVPASVVKF